MIPKMGAVFQIPSGGVGSGKQTCGHALRRIADIDALANALCFMQVIMGRSVPNEAAILRYM
jgi:hypothetical protein